MVQTHFSTCFNFEFLGWSFYISNNIYNCLVMLKLVDRLDLGSNALNSVNVQVVFTKKIYSLMVEQMTFNYWVNGSNPFISTFLKMFFYINEDLLQLEIIEKGQLKATIKIDREFVHLAKNLEDNLSKKVKKLIRTNDDWSKWRKTLVKQYFNSTSLDRRIIKKLYIFVHEELI